MRERWNQSPTAAAFACAVLLVLAPLLSARADSGPEPDAGVTRGSVYSPELSGAPIVYPDGGAEPRPDSATAIASPSPDTPASSTKEQVAPSGRTGVAGFVIAMMLLALKGALGVFKRVGDGTPWAKAQPWVQWLIIAGLSAVIVLLDAYLTGATWGAALKEMAAAFVGSWASDKANILATTNKVIARYATATGNTPVVPMAPAPTAPAGTTFRAGGTTP